MGYTPKKPKIWLSEKQVDAILRAARKRRERDFQIFRLCRYGLRIGEVVGRGRLRGIRLMDLRTDGIRILGKGGTETLYPLPRRVLRDLRRYIGCNNQNPTDRIFPITEWAITLCLKGYAKRRGIQDWERVSTHRLRAYFATDAKDRGFDSFLIRDLMRHRNLTTTNEYVGRSTPHALEQAMESLASRKG